MVCSKRCFVKYKKSLMYKDLAFKIIVLLLSKIEILLKLEFTISYIAKNGL
jgi:hypothetical protein